MKKKTTKKIANAYLRGDWWSGWHEEPLNGEWWCVANLPITVREYFRRKTVKAGRCWRDNPALIECLEGSIGG